MPYANISVKVFHERQAHLTGQRDRTATEHVQVNHYGPASSTFNATVRSRQIMRQRFLDSGGETIIDRTIPKQPMIRSTWWGWPDLANAVYHPALPARYRMGNPTSRRKYGRYMITLKQARLCQWSDLASGRRQRKQSAIARSLWQYLVGHRRGCPVYTAARRFARSWANSLAFRG